MAEVRLGVIGLGFMGGRWARALAEHAGARLAVVADVREDVAREVAERYGAAAVVDPLEAATSPDLDGVAVCTPEHLHTAAALAAIDAGKAVMVEKPLAHTVADAEQIRDRAAERGVPVLTGHTLRFEPRYAAVRRAIEAGEVGAVQAVRSERIGLVSDQQILSGRTSIALYYGVHEFDLCRWYAGEVEAIWAARSTGILEQRGYPVEDLYSVGLRFASGAHGTSMVGWCLPAGTPGYGIGGFTVIGEHGLLRVAQGDVGLLKVGEDGRVGRRRVLLPGGERAALRGGGDRGRPFRAGDKGRGRTGLHRRRRRGSGADRPGDGGGGPPGRGGAAVSENRYAVRAAVRVLDILDLLQQSADAVTLADVADATGLPKSSAFRYLATMESRGYVQRDTAGYHLGIGFLSSRAERLEVLAVRARPVLEEVRDRFEETVNLAVLDGTRAVYVEIVESRRGMRFAARRGDREPLHATALGKAIASTLDSDHVRAILAVEGMPQRTRRTITDPERFVQVVTTVARDGYAVDDRENEEDGRCVAVPLAGMHIPAAVSLAAPANRLTVDEAVVAAGSLRTAATEIARRMGGAT